MLFRLLTFKNAESSRHIKHIKTEEPVKHPRYAQLQQKRISKDPSLSPEKTKTFRYEILHQSVHSKTIFPSFSKSHSHLKHHYILFLSLSHAHQGSSQEKKGVFFSSSLVCVCVCVVGWGGCLLSKTCVKC